MGTNANLIIRDKDGNQAWLYRSYDGGEYGEILPPLWKLLDEISDKDSVVDANEFANLLLSQDKEDYWSLTDFTHEDYCSANYWYFIDLASESIAFGPDRSGIPHMIIGSKID